MAALSKLADAMRVVRRDGWENAILGMGGTKDPSAYTGYCARQPLSDETIEALYVGDHFAAKVVEALPDYALRAGWHLQITSDDPTEGARIRAEYATREEELRVNSEMGRGWKLGRAFGGAITWIGADDGRHPSEPLDETGVKTVEWLHTFDRRDVQIHKYYDDEGHPLFRQPEIYLIRPTTQSAPGGSIIPGAGTLVHESRCVRWGGQPTTDRRRLELGGWDDSVFERCWDALKQLAEDYGAKSMLLGRVSQAVYKIKGLYGLIAGKQKDVLRDRMGTLDISRSRGRAIVIDTDEDFVNVTQSLSGLPESLNSSVLRLASAANMPVTVLMGQSPAGMDATGESDLEVWGGTVGSDRELYLRERHERLARVLLLAKDGPTRGREPDGWAIVYAPLREPTRKELAEVAKIETETDALAIDKGIYSADHAAMRHGPAGAAPSLDAEEIKRRLERRKELAKQPPKDNAELGTVAPRTTAVLEVLAAVGQRSITRESGLAILTTIHRHTTEDAEALLGPPRPPAAPPPGSPGPAPTPQPGQGAGAPQPPR